MGIFRKKENRALDAAAIDPTLQALICTDDRITAEEAIQVPMVAACVEWISGTVARLPVQLFRKDGETITELTDDPRVKLLNRETGDLLDAYQLKKAWCRDYLLRGNGYLYIDKDGNKAQGLYFVDAKQVSVEKNADPIFKSAAFLVNGQRYRDFDFVRITRNTLDGVTGRGIVEESPLILRVAYETLRYQYQLVKAGGCRKGFLLSDKNIAKEVMDKLKEAWKKLFKSGEENVIVLNNGIKFQEASNTSVEMQMNENKKSDGESVCNLFGLSPALFSGNVTDEQYNNAVKTAVLPILDAMTEAYNKALLLESEKNSLYFEIDTRNLLKGDIEKRFSAYKLAAEANIMQLDEIRKRENLPALGMDFIKLGLQDVLYNPKTGELFTPNTGVKTNIHREDNPLSEADGERRYNKNRDPETGRFTFGPDRGYSGGGKGLTNSGESGNMKSSQKVSATGANRFEKGFSKANLKRHIKKHGSEYPDLSPEEYDQHALELIQQPVSKDVLGYKTADNAVVRYRVSTNDFVKGYPQTGIATMFKPKRNPEKGLRYFLNKQEEESVNDD